MALVKTEKEQLGFWQEKLKEYQKTYTRLRKKSPENWWHSEDWDIQMRVYENLIITTKIKIEKMKKKAQPKPTTS